jgi:hypothetical protein
MHGVDPVRLTATMVPFETLLKDLRSPRPWPDQAGPAPQLPASAWQRLFTLAVSIPDDASYYLLPAWHFSTHGYFIFDDLHKTYGFQPLYMLLLASLSMVLPSIEAVFRAGTAIR